MFGPDSSLYFYGRVCQTLISSVHLPFCSDVGAYLDDRHNIIAGITGFVLEHIDVHTSANESCVRLLDEFIEIRSDVTAQR